MVVTGNTLSCPSSENSYFAVENDGGEVIGNRCRRQKGKGGTTVQNALGAESSNTAFTDLTHRVSTSNVIRMADKLGVNINSFPNGSGLTDKLRQVGLALGTASLTVNEQTTMLSALAANGVYHQSHIVKYWQDSGDGPEQMPKVESHGVLDPSNPTNNALLDSQVQYAMGMTTVDGTGTPPPTGSATGRSSARPERPRTPTPGSSSARSRSTHWSSGCSPSRRTPKSPESLCQLAGGGFGGYWPAKIWNTFALAEFANLPPERFPNPVFTGAAWNQVGKLPKAEKPVCTKTVHGQKISIPGKGCPNPTPHRPASRTRTGTRSAGNNPQWQNQNDPNCNGQNPNADAHLPEPERPELQRAEPDAHLDL